MIAKNISDLGLESRLADVDVCSDGDNISCNLGSLNTSAAAGKPLKRIHPELEIASSIGKETFVYPVFKPREEYEVTITEARNAFNDSCELVNCSFQKFNFIVFMPKVSSIKIKKEIGPAQKIKLAAVSTQIVYRAEHPDDYIEGINENQPPIYEATFEVLEILAQNQEFYRVEAVSPLDPTKQIELITHSDKQIKKRDKLFSRFYFIGALQE